MTLDAAKWNGTGGELLSCVINTSIRSCIIIFETNLPVNLLSFFYFIYLYIYLCFLCIMIYIHSFHSTHIFKNIQYLIMVILLNYTAILCTVH